MVNCVFVHLKWTQMHENLIKTSVQSFMDSSKNHTRIRTTANLPNVKTSYKDQSAVNEVRKI